MLDKDCMKKYFVFFYLIFYCYFIFAEDIYINKNEQLFGPIEKKIINNVAYFSFTKIKKIINSKYIDYKNNFNTGEIELNLLNKIFKYNYLSNIFYDNETKKVYKIENEIKFQNSELFLTKEFLKWLLSKFSNIIFNENKIIIKGEIDSDASNLPPSREEVVVDSNSEDNLFNSELTDIFGEIIKNKKKAKEKITKIVIDPGHGGDDAGAVGKNNLKEKDIVLNVALKLRKILQTMKPELQIILTRDTDKFIPLLKRTEIANKAGADIFISLHCNSTFKKDKNLSGFETYYYYFKSDETSSIIEKIENSVIEKFEGNVDINQMYINLIKNDMLQIQYINESRDLAIEIQKMLDNVLKIENNYEILNRGIKKANFAVLQNALMPAVLVELGFISNLKESDLLKDNEFQNKLAEAIAKAIINYKEQYELK